MRAIVLAAGAGSRLWPYTATRPKPMVPVAGKPILGWLLEALAEGGIRDVQIVVGYKASRIQSAFEEGRDLGLRLTYVRQEVLLGTGAALATALSSGGLPERALVMGGDNIVDAALVNALVKAGPNTLAVARSPEPSKYGVVTMRGSRVLSIEEKPPIQGEALVSTGAALLDRELLGQVAKLVDSGMLGLAHILHHFATQGPGLNAVVDSGAWLDAVYPWDLLSLTELLVARRGRAADRGAQVAPGAFLEGPVVVGTGATVEAGAVVRGPSTIGANSRVCAGAVVSESVLMDDVIVGPGALVERSVVGDGTRIHGGAVLARGRGIAETVDGVHRIEDIGALVGEGCVIEGGAVLLPGVTLGNGCKVRAGARARGRIDAGGEVA